MRRVYVVFALVLPLLQACGGGGGSSSSAGTGNAPPPVTSAPELANLTPTQFAFDVITGRVDQSSFSFANQGNAGLDWQVVADGAFITLTGAAQGTLAQNTSTQVTFSVTCSGSDESGDLTLTTNDADEATVIIPVTVTCSPEPNYSISKVTYNQAARAFDSSVSGAPNIPLVAGRETLVRAFVTGDGPSPEAQVVISRPGQADAVFNMTLPPSISATPGTDDDLAGSHYAVIPGSAVQNNSRLTVRVGPAGGQVVFPAAGEFDWQVSDPGTLGVTFVPVRYQGRTPTLTEGYFNQSLQQMPVGAVDISIRAVYEFTGDFDLDRLLDEISDLRTLDGSGRLYHGIIIPPPTSVLPGSAQTAGIAFVGFPVGVSIDLSGSQNVISHEVGHNLGLRHAPGCNAPNADADFPYAEGAVVTWGWDILNDRLIEPTSTKRDLMSYCPDQWISDYFFAEALDFRNTSFNAPTATAGMQVRGRIVNGQVQNLSVLPAQQVRAQRLQRGNQHGTFRAWDASGQLLAVSEFNLFDIGERPGEVRFSFTTPATVADVHHIEFADDRGVLHRETLAQGSAPIAGEVNWAAEGARVAWQSGGYRAVIARDESGQVVSVDRSGALRLDGQASSYVLEMVQPGQPIMRQGVARGRPERLQWAP